MTVSADLVIRAPRAVTGDPGEPERPLAIGIRDGTIVAVEPLDTSALAGRDTLDLAAGEVLLPGLVDSHVHVCEPGNTEWEGFATATRAAAAGGITTLVDMPLDSVPVTVSVEALRAKRQAAAGQCHVDVAFWAGVIPGSAAQVGPLARAGVAGFKCFLSDSGSPDFPPVDPAQLTEALRITAGLGLPLLVHAECDPPAAPGPRPAAPGPRAAYAGYLAARPRQLENLAVARVIAAARATGGHAHIVHLSSADALPMIAAARRDGVRVTAETCPHYLTLAAEEITGTTAKCSPPVREAANRELLWAGLRENVLDMVVSDHSPCTEAMKAAGDWDRAWGGISSLQLGLPLTWTQARRRGVGLPQVAAWMSAAPARLAGLTAKGRIAPGCDADFCVLAPDESFTVDAAKLHHKHPKTTPYLGRTLSGVVRTTLLRGQPADPARPRGTLLTREPA
jgi:allantoinase